MLKGANGVAGSIARRPNGSWRARFRDESGKEHSKHFERKVDAKRWLDQISASIITDTYVDPQSGRDTFLEYYTEWSSRQVWVPGTVKAMNLATSRTPFRDFPLRLIRRSHVETWIKQMESEGLAPGTIKTRLHNVRGVFRAAHRERLIGTDPTHGVTLPRGRRAEHAMTIPTPADVGDLLHAADSSFRPFVAVCAFAGLRLGEAAGLQRRDIQFATGQIHVARQIQRAGGQEIEIRAPKYGSERVVALPEDLGALLQAHIDAVGELAEGWVFPTPLGTPPHQNTVGYWWRKTLRDAGMAGVKLHDLRHFYASGLIAAGCDVVTVQRALGHSKPTTTLNTYAHLWPSAENRTRMAAQSLMQASTKGDGLI